MTEFRFMLDSNICIYLLRDAVPSLTAKVADQPAGSLCLSSISLAEMAVGFGERAYVSPELRAFLTNIRLVDFDERAAKIYGALPFRRARFDRLIAAHALALGLTIVTNNEGDFEDIPGLSVENWTLPK